jgi:hypothetical protein
LSNKEEKVIVSNDPNDAMHEINRVDNHEISIQANKLEDMARKTEPNWVEEGPQVPSWPPFPGAEGLHSVDVGKALSIYDLVSYFLALLDLIRMLL